MTWYLGGNMRAVIYARYSAGPKQTDQSIDGQLRVCTEYCQNKSFVVVNTYIDRHISGKTDERPQFRQLIEDSKKGLFDAVVVYKTDRFSRNKYDSAIYKRELRKNNVQIFYAAEAIPEGPEGIILESLMEGLAEYYSAELSQKIKRGMKESFLKGKAIGGSLPFGYVKNSTGHFEINPAEAHAVKLVFKRYLSGVPAPKIATELNQLGYKTGRKAPFSKTSIYTMLSNEKYIGYYKYGDMESKDAIPAIISEDDFKKAQIMRLNRSRTRQKDNRVQNYLLSGKAYCGLCGEPLTGMSGTGQSGQVWHYYACHGARKKKICKKKSIRQDKLENLIATAAIDYLLANNNLEDLATLIHKKQLEQKTNNVELQTLNTKLNENKRAITNIIDAIEKGVVSEALTNRLNALEEGKIAIESKLAYYQTSLIVMSKKQIYFALTKFLQLNDEPIETWRARILSALVSKVYIYNDKLEIFFTLASPGQNSSTSVESTPLRA